jgi:eukaryotic-like serine/threonine-protein kinase
VEAHISRCDLCRKVLSVFVRTATPSPSTPRSGERFEAPVQFGRYVFAGELGAGGMGVVYAARDPELDRIVAVKLLRGESDPRRQDRLRREAQVMAQLAHPNVVAVYDVGVLEDGLFIAMEYVEGETLARWLAAPRSRREILDAYCAAGRGLAAAHAAGIVHRDFKPENVLVGKDGRVRVSDFGLARPTALRAQLRGTVAEGPGAALVAGLTPPLSDLTAPGTLMGTPRYMAPEVHGGKEADALSDQFSFCVGCSRRCTARRHSMVIASMCSRPTCAQAGCVNRGPRGGFRGASVRRSARPCGGAERTVRIAPRADRGAIAAAGSSASRARATRTLRR